MDQNFENISLDILTKKRRWKNWQKVVMVMACLVVFITIYALIIPVITMEKKTFCGIEEHIEHSFAEGCYTEEKKLVCTLEENNGHVHTDECYETTTKLVCDKELHIHTLICYSDPEADIEDKDSMEKSLSDVLLTGNWSNDITAVADSQLGYKESTKNYIVDENGNKSGYTRYGAWYGDEYADWSAMFVSFCIKFADISSKQLPVDGKCAHWVNTLTELDNYFTSQKYIPEKGDIAFLDMNGDGEADNVGIISSVVSIDGNKAIVFTVIQGDYEDTVQETSYNSSDKVVLGFCKLPSNPKISEQEEVTEVKKIEFTGSAKKIAKSFAIAVPEEFDENAENGAPEKETPALVNEPSEWMFDIYYLGQDDKHHVDKDSDFQLKYQMRFNSDVDIEPDSVNIRIPAILFTDRYGKDYLPSDIGVPMGTPGDFTASRMSPFNYYLDTETDELVFFNYKPITAGSTSVWQIYYDHINVIKVIDETSWDLPATAIVKDVPIVDENGNHICEDQTFTPEHLTGTVNTKITLNSVTKDAYTRPGETSYTPGLFTYNQIKQFAPDVKESDVDFENNVYVVWRVDAKIGYNQAWELYMKDTSYVSDEDQISPLVVNGEVVAGTVLSVIPEGGSRPAVRTTPSDSEFADEYPYFTESYDNSAIKSNESDHRSYFVVTSYPKEYVKNADVLRNEAEFLIHPVDDIDDDQVKSDPAAFTYEDYVWYYGDAGYNYIHKNTDTPKNNAWSNIYSYNSDVTRGPGNGTDHGGLRFNIESSVSAFLSTNKVQKDSDGGYCYIPDGTSYIPNTWVKTEICDDYVMAWPIATNDSLLLNTYKTLTKDDYYYSSVTVKTKDRAMDFYENAYIGPTSDSAVAAAGGDPVDRDMYIYAMFSDNEGGGYENDEWELVAVVPWAENGELTYTFTDTQLSREPYRVKAVHNSIDRCDTDIALTTVIKHDSPVFNAWYTQDDEASVRLDNYCAQVLTCHDKNGNDICYNDDIHGYEYVRTGDIPLEEFSEELYGVLPYRDHEVNDLFPLDVDADSRKSSTFKNDPVHGEYEITYTLEAYESYLIGNKNNIALLEENGVQALSERKHVEFYDLLPPDVQFDPSVPVKAYRMSSLAGKKSIMWNNTFSSDQVSVKTKEIIPDWNGTGRTMLVFAVDYSGADPSVASDERWAVGYRVIFGTYCRWEDGGQSLDISNIAAYMPASTDTQPLVGKPEQVAYDDGNIIPTSLGEYCEPFARGDINGDGVTDIRNVLYMEDANSQSMAIANNDFISKLVKSDKDIVGYYDVSAVVDPGSTYTYKITLTNPDAIPLSDLVIFDKLEHAAVDRYSQEPGMNFPDDPTRPWTGTFNGVDLQSAAALGIAPVVYYNADRDIPIQESRSEIYHSLDEEHGWYTSERWAEIGKTNADVKALAVDFSKDQYGNDFVLETDESGFSASISFTVNMTAPENVPSYIYAFNNPAYSSIKNKGLSSRTDSTVIGNSVKVALRDESHFVLEKKVKNAPSGRENEKFTFTIYDGDKHPVVYQLYHLYNYVDGEWVEDNNNKYSTDADGQVKLLADQKIEFYNTPGAGQFTAEETLSSIYWDSENVVEKNGNVTTSTFINTWKPPVYIRKELGGLSRFDTEGKYEDELFCLLVEYNDGSGWHPASDIEYGTVNKAETEAYSIPKYTEVGTSDANGIIEVYAGSIYAIQPAVMGSEYRVTEVAYDDDGNIIRPVDGEIAVGNWKTSEAVKEGELGQYGSEVTVTNYPTVKSVYVTKKLTSQLSENCDVEFSFRVLDNDGNPVAGVPWKAFDRTKDIVTDSFASDGVTDNDGKFNVKVSDIVRLYFDTDTQYTIEECHTQPDYKITGYEYDGTTISKGVEGFTFLFALTDTDGLATFTNDYRRRDISVTKQVLSDEVVTENFTMTLQKFNEVSGAWEVCSDASYKLMNNVGALIGNGITDANGRFALQGGRTATFTEIGTVGERFRVVEDWYPRYPQLIPATEMIEDDIETGAPLELEIGECGAEGTVVNGDPGMVLLNKRWLGNNDDATQWIKENADKLGVYLNVEIRKQGETDFREITPHDKCSYLLVSTDENGETHIDTIAMKNSSVYFADPVNTMLVLQSTDENWSTTSYRITETGIEQAGEGDSFTGVILGENGEKIYRLESVRTEAEGLTSVDSVADIINTVSAVEGNWIYKFIYGDLKPDEGSKITWRLERYTGSGWIPAPDVDYVVSYDIKSRMDADGNIIPPDVENGTVYKTDENGYIVLTDDGAVPTSIYEFAVGFFNDVRVGVEKGEVGDYRVVEIGEKTDPSWGSLMAYSDDSGRYSIKQKVDDPSGFVNTVRKKLIRIEKEMDDGTNGVGPFTFVLERELDKGKTPGGGIYYEVYDAETGGFKHSGHTDEKGEFKLMSGEFAVAEAAEMASWIVTERIGYPYELDNVDADSDIGHHIKGNEVRFDMPYARLTYGTMLKAAVLGNSSGIASDTSDYTVRSVTFGFNSQYSDIVAGITPIAVDENKQGMINLYRVQDSETGLFDVYILSDYEIRGNANSVNVFRNMKAVTDIDFENFNACDIENMTNFFSGCASLKNVDFTGFDTGKVTTMNSVFFGCSSLESFDMSGLDLSSLTDMGYMFSGCTKLKNIDFTGVDTSKVRSMASMFGNCSSLERPKLGDLDTGSVTNMMSMFYKCSNLISVDVSSWDMHNVESLSNMFRDCGNLTDIDMSKWNTTSLKDASYMLQLCSKLTTIDLSGWTASKLENIEWMFYGCSALTDVNLSGWDPGSEGKECKANSMFHSCRNIETVYSDVWNHIDANSEPFVYMSDKFKGRSVGGITWSNTNTDSRFARTDGGYFTDPSDKP